ncbi:MAG: hypothetical protein JNJ63_00455 [Hyphomonadaceae bacterium]|nr:hypothetical protein [Hyphomonadaceae bacterium]
MRLGTLLTALAVLWLGCSAASAQARLDATAANARYLLSASPTLLISASDPVSARTFLAAMGPDDGGLGAQPWSDLIAGAVQLRRESGDSGQTLWYNPVFDAAFFVAWRRNADGWEATDAALILGEALRDTRLSPTLGWMAWMRSELPTAELEALARDTIAAANAAPDWAALAFGRDAQRTLALLRVDRAAAGLRRVPPAALSDALDQLVHRGDGDPGTQAALEQVGVRAYQTLRPIGAWEGPNGATVALQAPDAPALTILAQLPSDGGAYRFSPAFTLRPASEADQ